MKKFSTYGIVPKIVNGKLRIFAFIQDEVSPDANAEPLQDLDDYLEEKPVQFSGLGEFQAIHVGVGYCPKSEKAKNKYGYNLVKVDPNFHIGDIKLDKTFAAAKPRPVGAQGEVQEGPKKVSFDDLTQFINWVNDPSKTPTAFSGFQDIESYVAAMRDAMKVLTDKILADFKFNELISGAKGQPVEGIVNVAQDENGDTTSSLEKAQLVNQEPSNGHKPSLITEGDLRKQSGKHFSMRRGLSGDTIKRFSEISISDPDTSQYSRGNLIGTILEAVKYYKLYHWLCGEGEYGPHKAFEEVVYELDKPLDELAEKCLIDEKISQFRNEVFPKGCPIDYSERLKKYVINASKMLFSQREDKDSFQDIINSIINALDHLIYQLKRLGVKTFSK